MPYSVGMSMTSVDGYTFYNTLNDVDSVDELKTFVSSEKGIAEIERKYYSVDSYRKHIYLLYFILTDKNSDKTILLKTKIHRVMKIDILD